MISSSHSNISCWAEEAPAMSALYHSSSSELLQAAIGGASLAGALTVYTLTHDLRLARYLEYKQPD